MEKKDLSTIKHFISNQIGCRVKLESNKRHNKSVINEGTIANVYPSIFTVEVGDNANATGRAMSTSNRTVSYSYTDILTNSVELTLYDNLTT